MEDIRTEYDFINRQAISNCPVEWAKVGEFLGEFSGLIKGDAGFLANFITTERVLQRATAVLASLVMTVKGSPIDLTFLTEVNHAKGKTFGVRLVKWAMEQINVEIPSNLRMAWGTFLALMGSTIERMIQEWEPVVAGGVILTPDLADKWINEHGGMGNLHRKHMDAMKVKKQADRDQRERDAERGRKQRLQEEAESKGFRSLDEYETAQIAETRQKQQLLLRSKYDRVKALLLENAMMLSSSEIPQNRRLLISDNGQIYLLSEDDERTLLDCRANILL